MNRIENVTMMLHRFLKFPLPKSNTFTLLIISVCVWMIGSLAMATPSGLRITIRTFAPYYSPTVVHIDTGTSISWDNPTNALHSITHDQCKTGAVCVFDSGPLGPNGTFTIRYLPPGSYPYHCSFHPIMQGVLLVQESDKTRQT